MIKTTNKNLPIKITLNDIINLLPNRPANSHKGMFGNLFCACGSLGMIGAAVLSARSALKCGVGIVNILSPNCIYPILANHLLESIFTVIEEDYENNLSNKSKTKILQALKKSDSCLLGCGLGNNNLSHNIIKFIINSCNSPLIIDADGINFISNNIDLLNKIKNQVILTPHPAEMARLLNTSVIDVQQNRYTYARDFAKKFNVTLVLKGMGTLIAVPSGKVYINETGNSGLSKGGSGDILAGMIASFAAQGLNNENAALCGVYLHGLAGDICSRYLSQTSMLPSDIINKLPDLFLKIEKTEIKNI